MKYSIPFLAKEETQLPPPGQNQAVEAVLFNREDLEGNAWEQSWKNIQHATTLYQPHNVTFHFPVNDADYVEDLRVASKLQEALKRAADLGLHGIVVHSNRIRLLNEWESIPILEWQKMVADRLHEIRERVPGECWLALENMPIMDNYGIEIDPLFVYPSDFTVLEGINVKIIWDLCHFTSTYANLCQLKSGDQQAKYYPNQKEMTPFDFLGIEKKIAHWHFSAFRGIANPDTGTTCREGVLPWESELGEKLYQELAEKIFQCDNQNRQIVFEIQEEDYAKRINAEKMMQWMKQYDPLFIDSAACANS